MSKAAEKYIGELVAPEHIRMQEPMSKHTTFRVGGPAKMLVQVEGTEQLQKIVSYLSRLEEPYIVIGNGSNLLVSDKGYDGVVLKIASGMENIQVLGERIHVQAGALLAKTAMEAAKHGLTGMEFASGIPGCIGGAVVMNAGAYDGEMSHVVESVTVVNQTGELMVLDRDTMEFSYRNSIIKNRPYIVAEAVLRLQKGEEAQIRSKMDEFAKLRREKQPLEYPSAGSTFKRPEGYFAGKLIMDAGLRGYRIGGAQVSEKHCGFLVNVGNATAEDIHELIMVVQETVKEKLHVELETEVIQIGEFS